MKQIKKAIVALDYPADELDAICEALGADDIVRCSSRDTDIIAASLADAQVAILGRPVKQIEKLAGPDLNWIHCDLAGLDSMYTPKLAENTQLVVTNSAGRSSKSLAEHVIMFMLALTYRINEIGDARKQRQWDMPFLKGARAMAGQTVGILGVGSIGKELAARCKAFDMKILGYGRSSGSVPGFDNVYLGREGLENVIRQSDFLVTALPLTDETFHLIGENELAQMKQSAYLINISRGAVVDECALVESLKNGRIAGAGLDTFECEPLPAGSPFWEMNQVVMTPHVTPQQTDKHEYSLELILKNIQAYREGRPMSNQYRPYYGFSGFDRR